MTFQHVGNIEVGIEGELVYEITRSAAGEVVEKRFLRRITKVPPARAEGSESMFRQFGPRVTEVRDWYRGKRPDGEWYDRRMR